MKSLASAVRLALSPVVVVVCSLLCTDAGDVWCRWNASCVLAASFPVGDDVVVHWMKEATGGVQVQVHSFYYDSDQLANQDERFRGRTWLLKEKLSEGNASLLLQEVRLEDEGRYKCYVGTLRDSLESFINLRVEAPVQDVRMELSDGAVFCRADGVYPAPALAWSTEPPADGGPFDYKTKVEPTRTGLYDVESRMQVTADASLRVDFTCEVSSKRSARRARLRMEDAIHAAFGSQVKIACSFPAEVDTFDLHWRFRRSEHILSMNVSGLQRRLTVSEDWKIHVMDWRSAWQHLKLPSVAPEHQGTYTCQVRTKELTYITQTDVIVTVDRKLVPLLGIIAAMGLLFLVGVAVAGFLWHKMRKLKKSKLQKAPEDKDADDDADKKQVTDAKHTDMRNLDVLSFQAIRQRYAKFLDRGATILQRLRHNSNTNAI
ncbi:CD276 antigen-like isoform X2 [Festucalex cinctus]